MNFGPCPYDGCEGALFLAVPDRTPAWSKTKCEDCGQAVWYHHSRVNPFALTEDQFAEKYQVDEITKTISER